MQPDRGETQDPTVKSRLHRVGFRHLFRQGFVMEKELATFHIALARASSREEFEALLRRTNELEVTLEDHGSELRIARATILLRLGRVEGFDVFETELLPSAERRRDEILGVIAANLSPLSEFAVHATDMLRYGSGAVAVGELVAALHRAEILDSASATVGAAVSRFFERIGSSQPDSIERALEIVLAFDRERRALNRAVLTDSVPPAEDLEFQFWRDRIPKFEASARELEDALRLSKPRGLGRGTQS